MVVFLVGLMTAIVLMARKVKGALLISIAVATIVAFIIEWLEAADVVARHPDVRAGA